MKSELYVVRGLARAILKDLSVKHPSIHASLSIDASRLVIADINSGLPFYTITLPLIAKFLERSLDRGTIEGVNRPPFCAAGSKLDRRPMLFRGLWSLIFDQDGTLRDDCCEDAVGSLRQILLFSKKLRLECDERFTNESIDTFEEIERSLPRPWDETWSSDTPRWIRRRGHPIWGSHAPEVDHIDDMFDTDPLHAYDESLDWEGFGALCARIVSQLGELNVYSASIAPSGGDAVNAMLRPKHGPGAVSDRTDHTKYDFAFWTRRLECVFPYDHFGAPNAGYADMVQYREFPSQLHAVPKTATGPRLIASEPTAHQWVQGAIANWIEARLKETKSPLCDSVNLRDQAASRDLAREASLTGSHATVDLKSASDRLTCRLVEFVFQGNRSLLDAFHASRTRAVEINLMGRRETILLRKFATQGSALTFPVQTMVFTLIAVHALSVARQIKDWPSVRELFHQIRVYGDDIIIPTDGYTVLVRMLSSLQLSVNEHKSFALGKFREACGMDAYNGVDVTPAYVRQVYGPAPTSLKSVIECSNNFFNKGYWCAADYLLKTVPPEELRLLPVVAPDSGAFGILSFCGESVEHLKQRWSKDLHRTEVRVLSIQTEVQKKRAKGHGDLTQFFYEFNHRESLVDISPYSGGQASALRSRKTTQWVDKLTTYPRASVSD